MDKPIDGWTDGRTDRQTNGRMDGRKLIILESHKRSTWRLINVKLNFDKKKHRLLGRHLRSDPIIILIMQLVEEDGHRFGAILDLMQ